MGITGIDRDEIITQSWSTPYKLKKKAPMGKVLSKAFELLKSHIAGIGLLLKIKSYLLNL